MKMFIDRKMFYQTNTALKIVKIDTSKKDNHCSIELLDLGTATNNLLKANGSRPEKKHQFKKECHDAYCYYSKAAREVSIEV